MLCHRKGNGRFILLDDERDTIILHDANFNKCVSTLQRLDYPRHEAIAIVATPVARWEWNPAYFRAREAA